MKILFTPTIRLLHEGRATYYRQLWQLMSYHLRRLYPMQNYPYFWKMEQTKTWLTFRHFQGITLGIWYKIYCQTTGAEFKRTASLPDICSAPGTRRVSGQRPERHPPDPRNLIANLKRFKAILIQWPFNVCQWRYTLTNYMEWYESLTNLMIVVMKQFFL